MTDDGHRLPWTDEQWAEAQRLVREAARRARVASTFLPLVGPLPGGQASVPTLDLKQDDPITGTIYKRLDIDDGATRKLTTISCDVYLRTQQAEDPALTSARQMLGRAAVLVGRLEDAIVFRGQPGAGQAPQRSSGELGAPGPVVRPALYTVSGGDMNRGLLHASGPQVGVPGSGAAQGSSLVSSIADAVGLLEGAGHFGPFTCVLGDKLFTAARTPDGSSLVLPADRFVPFLEGGVLLRSSTLPPGQGVVVAGAGAPVDLVVASDVHVSFLQRTIEPRYVLRISERLVLRVKQPEAIVRLVT